MQSDEGNNSQPRIFLKLGLEMFLSQELPYMFFTDYGFQKSFNFFLLLFFGVF
jgi:hypothetical protein